MEEKKNKNTKRIVIICLLILGIVLIGAGYFIYDMTYTDNSGEDKIEEDVEELLYTLDVYKSGNDLCLDKSELCTEVAFTIKTKNENTKVLAFDRDKNFILYSDGDLLRIYNRDLGESTAIVLENIYKKYELYPNNQKNNISGIVYTTTDDKIGYFNVATGDKLYEGKYDSQYNSLIQINEDYLSVSIDGKKAYLLSTKEEKEEISYEGEEGPGFAFSSYGIDKYIFVLKSCAGDCIIEKVYSNDKKEIYNKKISDQNISFYNNILYFAYDNKISKVDMDGNIVEGGTYTDIKGLINNYVVYVANNKLMLDNLNEEESKEVTTWSSNYSYDFYTSKYYTRSELDSMDETAKLEGLYIVINYASKDSNGNFGMEYCYTIDKEIKTYPIKEEMGGRAKPVLYLYPPETTNVKVEFEHPEYLTTTYPKYNNAWNVVASPNGDLYDKNHKYYYALYWDEIRYNEVDFYEGFYVESVDAINFLEEKLSLIGLNDKERNEFIMYWLPILESNKKSLVYFETTRERELGNKLIITPTPDSLLRLSIHIKKVNNKVDIKEQKLESFQRHGFTVIEWGGMIY